MIIGYAKLSGRPQPLDIDETRRTLIEAGAETVFIDVDQPWPASEPTQPDGLEAAMKAMHRGDALMTPSPTHLTGSLAGLVGLAQRLETLGASLRVLRLAGGQTLDTATPPGAMLLAALGVLAAFERPASAVTGFAPLQGFGQESYGPRRPRGRPPTATTQAAEIGRLRAAGMRATDIASRLKICRASVYRVLNLAPVAENFRMEMMGAE